KAPARLCRQADECGRALRRGNRRRLEGEPVSEGVAEPGGRDLPRQAATNRCAQARGRRQRRDDAARQARDPPPPSYPAGAIEIADSGRQDRDRTQHEYDREARRVGGEGRVGVVGWAKAQSCTRSINKSDAAPCPPSRANIARPLVGTALYSFCCEANAFG